MSLDVVSSDRFSYEPNHRSFVSERSDLAEYDLFRQIYDDLADVGFSMVSARTGETRIFFLEESEMDEDGDIRFWTFRMLKPDGNESDITCTIFND